MSANRFTKKKAWTIFFLTIIISLIAGSSFGVSYIYARRGAQEPKTEETIQIAITDNGYSGSSSQKLLTNLLLSNQVAKATNQAKDSVVVIVTKILNTVTTFFGQSYVEENAALGSGVIIDEDEEKMYILTNAHVLEDASEGYLYYNKDTNVPVYLVGESPADDLAVIYCFKSDIPEEMKQELKTAVLGDSDALRVGDLAIAIGSPYSMGLAHTVTSGIITAVNCDFSISDTNYGIQTDAALNPGNSGGALINEKGEVVGINSAGIRNGSVEGMGFAIPINKAKTLIEQFRSGYRSLKGTMNIGSSAFLTKREAERYHLESGVYIYTVERGGAAEKAGLRTGDVILSIDGERLDDAGKMDQILGKHAPGDVVTIEITRGRKIDEPLALKVTLGEESTLTTKLPTEPVIEAVNEAQ